MYSLNLSNEISISVEIDELITLPSFYEQITKQKQEL
jgi:hypothetical protein